MTTIVLIGPHGVGKTTLGTRLAARLGCAFHEEIGRTLMEAGTPAVVGADAAVRPADFDERVIVRELERDRAWLSAGGGTRVVESWHPANLAYALHRNPSVMRRHLPAVELGVRAVGVVVVVPLVASPQVLAQRLSEPGDPTKMLSYFARVARTAELFARLLGLATMPPLHIHAQRAYGLEAERSCR